MSIEKENVLVQVGDNMIFDNPVKGLKQSQECLKNCAESIENWLKGDGNAMILDGSPPKASKLTDGNPDPAVFPSISNGAQKQREEDMMGALKSPRLWADSNMDTSLAGALIQSQGVAKNSDKSGGKLMKRKRASVDGNALSIDKASLVTECRRELNYLFEYYKELSGQILKMEEGASSSNNSLIACLLEESNLSYSKLVEVIYEKLKEKEGISLAFVRGAVLSVGQRMPYGIANAEADVLEDESESCLWCWETRDMKLLPANQRGELNVRRVGRKKVHERISALSATLSALEISESQDNYKSNLSKTSVKLGKTLNAEEIRSLVEKKKQKNDTGMAEKAAKQKEKESTRDIQKEKLQTDKEIKKMQEEAEKEAKRREKEEAESKKQLKRQQEEAERDRRRRQREEAELKEQRSVKKQATIMERFLKAKKGNNTSLSVEKLSSMKDPICDSSCKVEVVNSTTALMDSAFSTQDSLALEDLRKLHSYGWHNLSRCNRSCYWGTRQNPKIELFKKLKLHESSVVLGPSSKAKTPIDEVATCDNGETSLNKIADYGSERPLNDHTSTAPLSVRSLRKKLLQFDKSNRPAYYGTWSKKSCAVGPRHPFKKDPDLDYDVDSDEEWEEEEPGESLSDCDKDADEERLEEENLKIEDEEESEDDFFVPDGYLSEDEGVEVDNKSDDETGSSPSDRPEVESEEIRLLLQRQKYLQNLTEQALRKGHPFVILNLMHEKTEMKVEDVNGTSKNEQMCLQALCMQACPGGFVVDISIDPCPQNEHQEVLLSQNKTNKTPSPTTAMLLDSDLPEIVSSIQSNSQGINKVLESLQGKFPTMPKSQLRNKVKEISDYVDNRWQVKKEILDRLGLSTSPGKGSKPKGITTFFSKRCLPPKSESISASDTSPQQCSKAQVLPGDGTQCSSV